MGHTHPVQDTTEGGAACSRHLGYCRTEWRVAATSTLARPTRLIGPPLDPAGGFAQIKHAGQRSVVDHPVREREAEGHHERREHGEWGCFSSRCDELPERTEAWLGVVRFQARALFPGMGSGGERAAAQKVQA